MAISIKRYVDITSGVSGGAGVPRRDLGLRLLTTSEQCPVDDVLEFSSADQVAAYFGATTPEAKQAAFYFGYVGAQVTRPKLISFARFVEKFPAKPTIISGKITLEDARAVTEGSITLTVGN